jgi:hypothetical protein
MMTRAQSGQVVSQTGGSGHEPANLGDILERVLDKGLVIVGDIRVSLLDIELLTIKLRLLIASVDTAKQLGIDWWEHDPWLSSGKRAPVERDHREELPPLEHAELQGEQAEDRTRPEPATQRPADESAH